MRDLNELRLTGGQGASADALDRVESLLGAVLPEAYKRLTRMVDEGVPEVAMFDAGELTTGISEFFSATADPDVPYGLAWYWKNRPTGLDSCYLPIARDGGDWLVCLDLRNVRGAVVLFDSTAGRVLPVAEDFESFLDALYE